MSSDPPNGAPSPAPEGSGGGLGSRSRDADDLELAAATRARGAELIEVLERHVPGEREHAEATGTYAFAGAVATGHGRGRAELIREAAKLHALDKLYIPAELLRAARGTPAGDERERLDSQHGAGPALARGTGVDETVCTWILHSGERFDGSGPGRVAGAEIPIESRLIRAACRCARSVAAHRASGAAQAAVRELRARSGGELDPSVAEPLAAMLERTTGPSLS